MLVAVMILKAENGARAVVAALRPVSPELLLLPELFESSAAANPELVTPAQARIAISLDPERFKYLNSRFIV